MMKANFAIGQIVYHARFAYRGVVVDVDTEFRRSEEWYETMVGKIRPERDQPWYLLLVDGQDKESYVPQQQLEATEDRTPIRHPHLTRYFKNFRDGYYLKVANDGELN
jgi:heat shock protein HspQ